MGRFLAQQRKDPQHKVAFPRELTLLKGFLGTDSRMGGKMTLQTKTERGYPREGRGEHVKLPVPIEGIGDKVLDQLISIGENGASY